LKLKCDDPLSNFAFNFNLRRYIKATLPIKTDVNSDFTIDTTKVGRCRLTLG
jgi:hypothetical protein